MSRSKHTQQIVSADCVVHIGQDCLAQLERDLQASAYSRKFVLVDENTLQHCLPTLITAVPSLRKAEVVEIESGESNKTVEIANRLWEVLTELGADRQSVMINLGGGVIGDLGGFVASTFKRGFDFMNVPTTLLAQVDASVGGKLGVNLNHLKNQVGIFTNPRAVYANPQFINTLAKNQVMSGYAEMLKHGLIADSAHYQALLDFDLSRIDLLEEHIAKSVFIKNQIVSDDPLEDNVRKWLNFGHTIGHAIETHSHENQSTALLHGEAVAIGMLCELYLSVKLLGLDDSILDQYTNFLTSHFPSFHIETMTHHRIIEIMRNDKKNVGHKMNFTLIPELGTAVHDQEVSADLVIEALNFYQKRVTSIRHEA